MDRKIKRKVMARLDKVDTFIYMEKERFRTVSEDEFECLHQIIRGAILAVENFEDNDVVKIHLWYGKINPNK